MAERSMAEGKSLKYVFFDFDQTISKCHVFSQLAGWGGKCFVAPPFALTEQGQIAKISELNAQGSCWIFDDVTQTIISQHTSSEPNEPASGVRPQVGEPWTRAALGGASRVETLRSLFVDLRSKGVVLVIITKGYIGAVKKLMTEEGLLKYFEKVYGNVGQFYGETDYDKLDHKDSGLEGDDDCALTTTKAVHIAGFLQKSGVEGSQAVLVEDDPAEIASVQDVCRSVFVSQRQGMTPLEMHELRCLAGAPQVNAAPAQVGQSSGRKGVPRTMDKYRKVQKPKDTAAEKFEGEIRVAAKGSVSAYVSRASQVYGELNQSKVVITAAGNALTKAVTSAEVIKRRFKGLHQITNLGSQEVVDEYEPTEEGLDKVTETRSIPFIEITLSKEILDTSNKGYQAPLDESLVKELDPEELEKPRGRGRGKGRGKGKSKGKGKGNGKNKGKDSVKENEPKGKGKGKVTKGKGKGKAEEEPKGRGRGKSKGKGKGKVEEPKGKGKSKKNGRAASYDYDDWYETPKGSKGKTKSKSKGKGKSSYDDWYETPKGSKGKGKSKSNGQGKGKSSYDDWYEAPKASKGKGKGKARGKSKGWGSW